MSDTSVASGTSRFLVSILEEVSGVDVCLGSPNGTGGKRVVAAGSTLSVQGVDVGGIECVGTLVAENGSAGKVCVDDLETGGNKLAISVLVCNIFANDGPVDLFHAGESLQFICSLDKLNVWL